MKAAFVTNELSRERGNLGRLCKLVAARLNSDFRFERVREELLSHFCEYIKLCKSRARALD